MRDEITYYVTAILRPRPWDKHPPKIVEERLNGFAVNRYTAYDYGGVLKLYPMKGGKLKPSTIPYEPKEISIYDTRRGF